MSRGGFGGFGTADAPWRLSPAGDDLSSVVLNTAEKAGLECVHVERNQ
jgi:hypothetical protein